MPSLQPIGLPEMVESNGNYIRYGIRFGYYQNIMLQYDLKLQMEGDISDREVELRDEAKSHLKEGEFDVYVNSMLRLFHIIRREDTIKNVGVSIPFDELENDYIDQEVEDAWDEYFSISFSDSRELVMMLKSVDGITAINRVFGPEYNEFDQKKISFVKDLISYGRAKGDSDVLDMVYEQAKMGCTRSQALYIKTLIEPRLVKEGFENSTDERPVLDIMLSLDSDEDTEDDPDSQKEKEVPGAVVGSDEDDIINRA